MSCWVCHFCSIPNDRVRTAASQPAADNSCLSMWFWVRIPHPSSKLPVYAFHGAIICWTFGSRTPLGSNPAFSRGRQLVSFRKSRACARASKYNKHVYRQSQVRMPNSSGVGWAECSLIMGLGCRVQVFSLILDSSVGLSAGIQSAGDSVPEILWVRMHSAEEDNLSPFESKIACLCQSIEINNKHVCIYIAKARRECQTAVGSSALNARWL